MRNIFHDSIQVNDDAVIIQNSPGGHSTPYRGTICFDKWYRKVCYTTSLHNGMNHYPPIFFISVKVDYRKPNQIIGMAVTEYLGETGITENNFSFNCRAKDSRRYAVNKISISPC